MQPILKFVVNNQIIERTDTFSNIPPDILVIVPVTFLTEIE